MQWWRAQDFDGQADGVLMTLTVRHRAGMNLKMLRQGLARAWRAMEQSRVWRAFRKECRMRHHIRCQEVTWGEEKAWHPHLHVLLFCEKPEVGEQYFARNEKTGRCSGLLVDAWRHHVVRELGKECLPNTRHALDLDGCDDETYIARMGLEVGAPGAKRAKDGHLTAMQLAKRLATTKGPEQERLAALWREYAMAMHGAHQLHWSKGLREKIGIAVSDDDVVELAEGTDRPVLCTIPSETWHDMAKQVGIAPLDTLGRSQHGRSVPDQLRAILQFFSELQRQPCHWTMVDSSLCLRWGFS